MGDGLACVPGCDYFQSSMPKLAMLSGVLGSTERYPHLATVALFSIFGDVMT